MRENKITISVNTFYFFPYSWFSHAQWTPLISRYFHDFPMKQMLLQNPWQTLTTKANVDRLDLGLLTNNKTCKFIKNNTILHQIFIKCMGWRELWFYEFLDACARKDELDMSNWEPCLLVYVDSPALPLPVTWVRVPDGRDRLPREGTPETSGRSPPGTQCGQIVRIPRSRSLFTAHV